MRELSMNEISIVSGGHNDDGGGDSSRRDGPDDETWWDTVRRAVREIPELHDDAVTAIVDVACRVTGKC
ncbi:MAG: hypothetical protein L3J24_04425 [Xanthomonadales bacterium]|nr:hypothetical protein [Xanthomonadales bacterium]